MFPPGRRPRGKTQDTLERLCLSAGLGTPQGPPRRAVGSLWARQQIWGCVTVPPASDPHYCPGPQETLDGPVALTSVVRKFFERPVLAHLKDITVQPPSPTTCSLPTEKT
ncbi:hypothetical protein L3Q82_026839, partial [Scortum barcoo]